MSSRKIITLYGPSGAGKSLYSLVASLDLNCKPLLLFHISIVRILSEIFTRVISTSKEESEIIKARATALDCLLSLLIMPWILPLKFMSKNCIIAEEGAPGVFCSCIYSQILGNALFLRKIHAVLVAWLIEETKGYRFLLKTNIESYRNRWIKRGRGESEAYQFFRLILCPLWQRELKDLIIYSRDWRDVCKFLRYIKSGGI